MHHETPAIPQTRALLFPFSASHNQQLKSGIPSQNQLQNQGQTQNQNQYDCRWMKLRKEFKITESSTFPFLGGRLGWGCGGQNKG
ncbi:MAG: hypothetical protein V4447_06370 [Pseudomonadota bacterium]